MPIKKSGIKTTLWLPNDVKAILARYRKEGVSQSWAVSEAVRYFANTALGHHKNIRLKKMAEINSK